MSSSSPPASPPLAQEKARFQPPFPPSGAAQHGQSPHGPNRDGRIYAGAEQIANAAAAHVFPEHPAPSKEDAGWSEGESDSSSKDPSPAENKEPEQTPIAKGTPLDELLTPGGGAPSRTLSAAGSALPTLNEQAQTSTPTFGTSPILPVESTTAEKSQDLTAPSPAPTIEQQVPTSRPAPRVATSTKRPPSFGPGHEIGSVRMGASALFSALNALPWEEDEDSGTDEDEEKRHRKAFSRKERQKVQRPKASRMHSSLHTIRPMATPTDDLDLGDQENYPPHGVHHSLHFPFRQNTIARRAQRPGEQELSYQLAGHPPQASGIPGAVPPVADEATVPEAGIPVAGAEEIHNVHSIARVPLQRRVTEEAKISQDETKQEIEEADVGDEEAPADLAPVISADSEASLSTSLPQAHEGDQTIGDQLSVSNHEKRQVRMEMLAGKLQQIFGLEEREEVLEEMRCWLLRSVMLKGYMYLTPRRICFFAHMPSKENLIAKTGPLSKKNSRTKLYTKFWAVLRNDVLSWYESASDPYFPHGNVSLQYASSCEELDETRFKLRTVERNYTFTADTESARDEWVKAIRKVMFKTQHEGESVKLIIPLEAVMEVDTAHTLEFAETIEIKCVDAEDAMSVDSYFFASFQNTARTLSSIQRLLSQRPAFELPQPVPQSSSDDLDPAPEDRQEVSGMFNLRKIGSVLKPLVSRSTENGDESKDTEKHRSSSLPIPFLKRQQASNDSMETVRMEQSPIETLGADSFEELGGYPPRQTGTAPHGFGEEKATWGTWIKRPASKIFGTSPSHTSLFGRSPGSAPSLVRSPSSASTVGRGRARRDRKRAAVTAVVEAADDSTSSEEECSPQRPRMQWTSDSDLEKDMDMDTSRRSDFSLMEKSESHDNEEQEMARKFRKVFALSDTEELIDHFPGYLYRVLPVSGRFFISTNFFCFRSSQLLYKTKMIIPIRDLYGLKAQKAFRFGHSGLILVIKGHEELFLEFSSSDRRTVCVQLLEERMEDARIKSTSGEEPVQDSDSVALRIAEDLDENAPLESRSSGSIASPSHMFGSTTSTFLEFKPEPMRITCLTIGSRGDVQPYIALCKGLQAEGHTTRIATHGEYKDWVEGHGIEFASVGGDPAELMQMCVDNGMFTVSFLKEGLQKFRGWLDDLLTSSWEACQGSDLLIESPSAMGGIHIAEALRIPYYRAFTMPWTRTRAYPHAFAVPEHRRGGSYNYMTYTMFDQVFWRAIAGQVNRFRRKVLGIDATTFDKLEQHKCPFLYNFSPNVVPPPLDWTEWIHVTGYWFLENADQSQAAERKWSPPKGLIEFIDNAHEVGKKVVYIGFGSIVVSDPQEMTRCVVDAVVESGVCAILSKGWSDRGTKAKGESVSSSDGADGIKFPPEIFAIDSIDHGWLFPRIDAACHHGGAGTTGASLRAGIPTIIKPFFGDQSFWAERVESLNVGSAVRKLTSESLAEALKKSTQDERQIGKARAVGEMIRNENGVARAIEAIYRDLEYAKSIIKPPPEDKSLSKTSSLSLLHPLISSSDLGGHRRSGSKASQKRALSAVRSEVSEDFDHSDTSWDVLSDDRHDSGARSLLASPMLGAVDAVRSRKGSGSGSVTSGFLGRVGLSRASRVSEG